MTANNSLPKDLLMSAQALEVRFNILRVPSHTIAESEWYSLPESIRQLIPVWIPALLSKFKLAGGVLEHRDRTHSSNRQFCFFNPTDFASELSDDSLLQRLPQFGYVPFAYEHNGSVWVMEITGQVSGVIYLLNLPDWNGAKPTPQNGLVFASSRLSLLLASMSVSEVSYYDVQGGITSVLWHMEK